MAHRIEVSSTIPDMRASVRRRKLQRLGFPVQQVQLSDVYTVDADAVISVAQQQGIEAQFIGEVNQGPELSIVSHGVKNPGDTLLFKEE